MKEKRGRIKPVIARLHREFNISAAEVDRQDMWQETVLACSVVTNEPNQTQRVLQQVVNYMGNTWMDLELIDHKIELL